MKSTKITAVCTVAALTSSFAMTGCTNYEELLKSDRSGYLEIAFKNTAKAIAKKNKTTAFNDFISSVKKDCVSVNVNNPDFDIFMKMSGYHENKTNLPNIP